MNKLILLGILVLFSTTIILTQTIFSQTIENEIIEKTLKTVEKATGGENTLETVEDVLSTNSNALNNIHNLNEINQNSLAACVDYFDNEYETQKEGLSDSVQQGLESIFNENNRNLIHVAICDMGFEHTGKYSHLLSKDLQHKYVKLVAARILLDKKSFETPSLPTNTQNIIDKLFTPVSANTSALGDEQAKIIIVEFADYQCPFCAKFHKETKSSIIENFVNTGKAKFIFKDLIVNDRPNDKASTLAASASYCAAEQGKYWEYNDELYKNSQGENTGWVTKDNLKQFANNIRIPDITKFSECLESNKYNNLIVENDSLGKDIGLTATPTFLFYNGTTPVAVQGAQPYELFEQIINAML